MYTMGKKRNSSSFYISATHQIYASWDAVVQLGRDHEVRQPLAARQGGSGNLNAPSAGLDNTVFPGVLFLFSIIPTASWWREPSSGNASRVGRYVL